MLDAGKRVSVLAQGQIQPLGVAMTREGHIAVTDCQGKRVRVRPVIGRICRITSVLIALHFSRQSRE